MQLRFILRKTVTALSALNQPTYKNSVPVTEVVQRQRLRSATDSDLCVPHVATDQSGRRAFAVAGP